ncbi:MAG: PQQ-binding-like beta-propeller repeat protein [Candidatus Hinthialibacter antarcticus]|nr:PQQ-binding-like beta-propeller repeat protein [Candidatus Hinthialibacter antarcticus]
MSNTQGVTVWRMAGGDPSRCGLSAQSLSKEPKLTDTLKASGSVVGSPVFSQSGSVFIADRAGGVQAYNSDGKLLWRRDLPGGFQASPAINNDASVLYVGSLLGRVHALDAKTGQPVWEVMLPARRDRRIQSDLLYLDEHDAVITSSWGGKFVALSGKNGTKTQEWNAGDNPRTAMSASPDGGLYGIRVASSNRGNQIEVFNAVLGFDETLLYQQAVKGTVNAFASPVVWHDGVIVPINGNTTCSLKYIYQKKSEPKKLMDLDCCIHATPAVFRDGIDKLFVATMNGDIAALPIYRDQGDINNYSTASPANGEYYLASPVCDASGNAYLGSPQGNLYRFDSEFQRTVIFEGTRAFETQPAISPDGRLYAPCTDGNVFVFA